MASFGEELKRERELRDISLKEIAEATKISIRFLEALECNDFDILPGGIFNRGFIRAYARFIGVDGEEMVNSYLHELSMQEKKKSRPGAGPAKSPGVAPAPAKETRGPAPREDFFRPERSAIRPKPSAGLVTGIEEAETFKPKLPEGGPSARSTMILWVAVVITLLIGAAAVTLNQLGPGEETESQTVAVAGSGEAARPQEAATGPPAPRPASPEKNADHRDNPIAPSGGSEPRATQESSPPRDAGHSLWVRATEFNYIRIECGDGVALDQELLPNQSRTVKCDPPGRISALNAGALQYAIDGGPALLLGEMGRKVEGITVIAASDDGSAGGRPEETQ